MHTSTDVGRQPHASMAATSDAWDQIKKRLTRESVAEAVLALLALGLCGFLCLALRRAMQGYEILGPGPF